jgi:hypothetical protein
VSYGVNSGGLSNSGPIWPGGKTPVSKELAPADEAFQMHKEVSAPGTKSASSVKAPSESAAGPTKPSAAPVVETQIKSLTAKDILQQLATIKVPVNDHNKDLALLMATHGVEISEDSFALVNKLLKGKKSLSAKEHAVLLVSKGLGDAADDVGILQNLLGKNGVMSKTLKHLEAMQQKMGTLLQKSLKDAPGLSSFAALFDEFNDNLKKIRKMNRDNQWLSSPGEFIDDLFAMTGFLKGLMKKGVLNGSLANQYLKALAQLKENAMAQLILSQESIKQPLGLLESYHYFQIPNPLAAQAVIELLLRKQATKKSTSSKRTDDDKDQEKIILSMDSEALGKVTVILTVLGFKVWCTVYSDKESAVHHASSFRQELADNLAKHQYEMTSFKTARKKINIQKFIAPSQDISKVKRIQTEI